MLINPVNILIMVKQILIRNIHQNYPNKERLRQQAIKEQEKERLMFYQKQKEGQKDVRSKYREKVHFLNSAHIARSD